MSELINQRKVSKKFNTFSSTASFLASLAMIWQLLFLERDGSILGVALSGIVLVSFSLFYIYSLGYFNKNHDIFVYTERTRQMAFLLFVVAIIIESGVILFA